MKNENEKTVSEMEAERISAWINDYSEKYDWKVDAALAYEGPGTYEGEVSVETEDDEFTTGFEAISRQYNLRDFLRLLENVTVMHNGKEYALRDGIVIRNIAFRSPRKGSANVDLKDLDDYMVDLHYGLGITDDQEDEWQKQDTAEFRKEHPGAFYIWHVQSDDVTTVNIHDGKVTGVIMDDRDRSNETFAVESLQELYDYLDQQFAPLIHDEGAEHLDGMVITTYPWGESDYEDNKGENSRVVYDNEHNVVIAETGTFIFSDEENEELRQEAGEDIDYDDE